MSINLYKKKTINNQPVLEELLSKSTDTVDNKPLVYDSTTDNVKSVDNLNVNSVTASCFHGPLDGTAKNATCFNNKTYAEACADILNGCAADSNKFNGKTYSEACADILSGCAADSNKLNGKTYSEVCADILSGTAANATCFAGKTCTEWKEIIKTTCVDNAALATNATCFNGCTYAQACTDIRDGLATQTCVDAVQNCADFIQSCVTAIESKIPAQASASNQLADKDFVNSSITTNTANFRGTYACVAELPSTGNTNNDYAFVCSLNTTTGNYIYDRYKWVASDSCWVCEYELNTTGFTAEQLASINSGITSNLVAKITDVYDNTVTVCMNGECKGSFNLNQNTDVCIDLGDTIRNACCADYATNAAQASSATNATCFDGCTYAQAKADIRNYTPSYATCTLCPIIHASDETTASQHKIPFTKYYGSTNDETPLVYDNCLIYTTVQQRLSTPNLCVSGCAEITSAQILCIQTYNVIEGKAREACCSTCAQTVYTSGSSNTRKLLSSTCGWSTPLQTYIDYCLDSNTLSNANIDISGCSLKAKTACFTGNVDVDCNVNIGGNLNVTGTLTGTANNATCFNGKTYSQAKTDILSGNAASATNATCFGGCTYACAKADFRNYTPTLATCATCVARCVAASGTCYLALFNANTASTGTNLYVSGAMQVAFCPATGILSTCCVKGISGLIAGNPIGCTSSVLGQAGTLVSSGSLELYRSTPLIDFHVNNATADFTQRISAGCGVLNVCVNNGTGCTAATQTGCFYFCSDGTLKAACFDGNAKTATNATTATNSTCFGGCTYACAKADILSGCAADSAKLGNKAASCYIDNSSTMQTKTGSLLIGDPAACTSTSAGGQGATINNIGGIDLFRDTCPFIDFHYQKYCGDYSSRITNLYATNSCNGILRMTINNGKGCTTPNISTNYDFYSDGTFTGASTICASTNIYSAGCPVVTTRTLPTVAPGYNCTGTVSSISLNGCAFTVNNGSASLTGFKPATAGVADSAIGLCRTAENVNSPRPLLLAGGCSTIANGYTYVDSDNKITYNTCTNLLTLDKARVNCCTTYNNQYVQGVMFCKADNSGYPTFRILADVTNWWNYYGTSSSVCGMELIGEVFIHRCGGYENCSIAIIDAHVNYRRQDANPTATNNTLVLGLGYTSLIGTGQVIPMIVCCGSCKYLAIRLTGSGKNFVFNGICNNVTIGTEYCYTSATALPSGWTIVVDGENRVAPLVATNSTCFGGCTYACAKADIRNYTPSLATNATCFNGCTYAQACSNIRSGLTGCTGTVTSVNVSVNGCSGTAVTTSGTVTLTNVPTCKIYKTMATASSNRNVLLGEASEAAGYGCVYVGNCCKLTFNPATGVLTAKTFCGALSGTSTTSDYTCINCYTDNSDYDMAIVFGGSQPLGNVGVAESRFRLIFNPATGRLILRDTCNTCCNDTVISSNYSDDYTICTRGGAQFGYDVAGYYENEIDCDACNSWFIVCDGYAEFNRLACNIVGICTCGYMQAEGYQFKSSTIGNSCFALLCGDYNSVGINSYCGGTTRNILKVDSSGNTALGYCACGVNALSTAVGYMSCSNIGGVAIGQRACAATSGVAIGSCTCSSGPGIAIGYRACADGFGPSGNLFGLALGHEAYSISTGLGSTASIIKMACSYKLGSIYILSDDKQCDIFNMLYCFISKNLGSFDSFTSCCIPVGIIQDMIYRCSANSNIKSYDVSDRWLDYVACSSTCCYFTIRGKYNIYKDCTATNVSGCGVNAMTIIL
ncbi:MAG: hypothetical protein J6S67_02685 [Methanobrevibacter sp.]|nr:hypothetical protein [Methanobrevibacter sp.]